MHASLDAASVFPLNCKDQFCWYLFNLLGKSPNTRIWLKRLCTLLEKNNLKIKMPIKLTFLLLLWTTQNMKNIKKSGVSCPWYIAHHWFMLLNLYNNLLMIIVSINIIINTFDLLKCKVSHFIKLFVFVKTCIWTVNYAFYCLLWYYRRCPTVPRSWYSFYLCRS